MANGKWQMANFCPLPPLLALAICLLPSTICHAISDNAGTKNGDFLRIGTDARGVALGDSAVSMARGADALRWNPAALGILDGKEVSATHIQYYQDVHIENVSAVYPVEEGGLGASVFYLSPGVLDGRDALLGSPTGDFSFYDLVGSLAYGRKMLTRAEGMDVSVGAAVKLVQEKIADQSFQNPAYDIGVLASPKDDLNLGFTVRDLSSGKANYVREMIGGASYTIYHVFTGAFAVNYSNDSPIRYSVGAEYKIPELEEGAVVRAGYETHDSLDDSLDSQIPGLRGASIAGLTMGGGIDYTPPLFSKIKFVIDYAMAPFGALGISHTVTVKAKW
jgi:hypothetical protein